jgi:hypothetical protein
MKVRGWRKSASVFGSGEVPTSEFMVVVVQQGANTNQGLGQVPPLDSGLFTFSGNLMW